MLTSQMFLKKLIKFKQTNNEIKNRLEQLRAIENGIKINVALAKTALSGLIQWKII